MGNAPAGAPLATNDRLAGSKRNHWGNGLPVDVVAWSAPPPPRKSAGSENRKLLPDPSGALLTKTEALPDSCSVGSRSIVICGPLPPDAVGVLSSKLLAYAAVMPNGAKDLGSAGRSDGAGNRAPVKGDKSLMLAVVLAVLSISM